VDECKPLVGGTWEGVERVVREEELVVRGRATAAEAAASGLMATELEHGMGQGLTLVHSSAQHKQLLWTRWVVSVGFGDKNGSVELRSEHV